MREKSEMLPKTVFIADLHLDKKFPDAVSAFFAYLQELSQQPIDALYILGDLFEYWLGDDCADSTALQVAQNLTAFRKQTGAPIYYICGNRDFLLRQGFARQCSMQILPEHSEIDLYGIRTLVLHGDTLCTADEAYMHFRNEVRTAQWQEKILRLPAWVRRLKAQHMRYSSKKANARKSLAIMDVTHDAVDSLVRQTGVVQIIHGHTHRPHIHEFVVDGQAIRRCVVGDWYSQASALEVTAESTELIDWSFKEKTL